MLIISKISLISHVIDLYLFAKLYKIYNESTVIIKMSDA